MIENLSLLNLDDRLPIGLGLPYLCTLAGLDKSWSVLVFEGQLNHDKASSLATDEFRRATIILNSLYFFPPRTMARAITHELLELVLMPLWEVDVNLIGRLPFIDQAVWASRVRSCRDAVIDSRLDQMPYWKPYDVPIPKEALYARNI